MFDIVISERMEREKGGIQEESWPMCEKIARSYVKPIVVNRHDKFLIFVFILFYKFVP